MVRSICLTSVLCLAVLTSLSDTATSDGSSISKLVQAIVDTADSSDTPNMIKSCDFEENVCGLSNMGIDFVGSITKLPHLSRVKQDMASGNTGYAMVWDNDADTERRVEQAVIQTGYLTTYHSSVCVIFDLLMDKSTATLNVFKEDTGHTELPLDLKGVSKSNWSRIYGDVATSKGNLFKIVFDFTRAELFTDVFAAIDDIRIIEGSCLAVQNSEDKNEAKNENATSTQHIQTTVGTVEEVSKTIIPSEKTMETTTALIPDNVTSSSSLKVSDYNMNNSTTQQSSGATRPSAHSSAQDNWSTTSDMVTENPSESTVTFQSNQTTTGFLANVKFTTDAPVFVKESTTNSQWNLTTAGIYETETSFTESPNNSTADLNTTVLLVNQTTSGYQWNTTTTGSLETETFSTNTPTRDIDDSTSSLIEQSTTGYQWNTTTTGSLETSTSFTNAPTQDIDDSTSSLIEQSTTGYQWNTTTTGSLETQTVPTGLPSTKSNNQESTTFKHLESTTDFEDGIISTTIISISTTKSPKYTTKLTKQTTKTTPTPVTVTKAKPGTTVKTLSTPESTKPSKGLRATATDSVIVCPKDRTVLLPVNASTTEIHVVSPFDTNGILTYENIQQGEHKFVMRRKGLACQFVITVKETVRPVHAYISWTAAYSSGCNSGVISSFASKVINNLAAHHFTSFIRPLCTVPDIMETCALMEPEAMLSCQQNELSVKWETTTDLRDDTRQRQRNTISLLKRNVQQAQKRVNNQSSSRWLQMVVPDRMPPFLDVSMVQGLLITPELDVSCPTDSYYDKENIACVL